MSEQMEISKIDAMALYFAEKVADAASKLPDNRLSGVKLFGSYARGEQKPSSDVDILVIWNGPQADVKSREKFEDQIYERLASEGVYSGEGLHILAVSKSVFDNPDLDESGAMRKMKNESVDISVVPEPVR